MASFVFDSGADGLTSGGGITWASDTIKARLGASSVTPAKADASMTGYTGIGTDQTVTTKTKTKDTTNHIEKFSFDAVTWSAVATGSTVGWIVIYKFVTNDAGSTPIAAIDVNPDVPTNGSDMTYTPDATNGAFYTQQ